MTRPQKKRIAFGMLASSLVLAATLFTVHSCWLPDSSAVICDTDRICPQGTVCTVDGDACIPETGGCGDGIINGKAGETCDDGNHTSEDGCSAMCQAENCGDGTIAPDEDCDDGNQVLTDDCPSGPSGTCLPARCGDGFVQKGIEECDDGNNSNGDACPDNVLEADGKPTCRVATCGDGHVWSGHEDCDNHTEDPAMCDPDCTFAECGDGHVNRDSGEACDDGNKNNNDACPDNNTGTPPPAALPGPGCRPVDTPSLPACELARCGDGHVWAGVEECDPNDPGDLDRASCDCITCRRQRCGNGIVDPGEECDDGNHNLNDACPDGPGGTCQFAVCGDGLRWNKQGGQERCDCPGGVACDDCDGDPCKDDCLSCL